jgi:hypothetical protein
VRITNSGAEPAKVILVFFGEYGFCPPSCAGPLRVECSGLLAPQGTWEYDVSAAGEGLKAAVLFSLTTRTMAAIGGEPSSDTMVADALCDILTTVMMGSGDTYRQFLLAYDEGRSFARIPLARAYGGPLAVDIERTCPGDPTSSIEVRSDYDGLAAADLEPVMPTPGRFAYYARDVYADHSGLRSVMYLQNADLECAAVSAHFRETGAPVPEQICEIFALSPGETYQFDATDCVGPNWRGSVTLESEQALALVVDQIGLDQLRTYAGLTGTDPYDLNFDGLVDDLDRAILEAARGSAPGESRWNPRADLNVDGVVDDADADLLAAHMTRPQPTPTVTPTRQAPPTLVRPTLTPPPGRPIYLPLLRFDQ